MMLKITPDFSGLIAAQKDQAKPAWLKNVDRARPHTDQSPTRREEEPQAKPGSDGAGLVPALPIDYPRGGPQTSPDIERQIAVLEAAIEQGESVPVIVKRYGISRTAVQTYIAEMREEVEINSQLLDLRLSQLFGDKLEEIAMAINKNKLDKAGVKDLAIAAGIFSDKRKELLGPRSGGGNLRLRAIFKGEGAIEIRQDD
ncbi:MAG: hypothetical protein HPY66_1673 [Firmicutes bacterium]|nr:hypothetical protein [Bacillota bacterium]